MNLGQNSLGIGNILVELLDDLLKILANTAVLLDAFLELVEKRGINHRGGHLEEVVVS